MAGTPIHDDPRASGTFFFPEALSQGMLLASPGTGGSAEKAHCVPLLQSAFQNEFNRHRWAGVGG